MGGVGVAGQGAFVLYGAEAFIIDVLVHCSPIVNHQKLAKTIDDEQGRRRGAGDGDHQWDRACAPVLPRDPQLAGGAQESVTSHHGFLRRPLLRRRGERPMSRCCRNRAARPATLRTWSGMTTTCSGTGKLCDRWPLVVKLSDQVEVEWFRQVPPISELGENDIGVSGIGTIAAARVAPRGRPEDSFVVASMYATGTPWRVGAADVSAHRILSDLSAFIGHGNPAKHRILAAGDLNIIVRRDRRRAVAARARTGCVGPDRGARAGVSPAATAKRTAGGDGSAGCAGRYQERPDVLQPAAALASQCRSPVGGTERPRRKDLSSRTPSQDIPAPLELDHGKEREPLGHAGSAARECSCSCPRIIVHSSFPKWKPWWEWKSIA